MNSEKNIPFEWFKYRNQTAHFITYFGDIYHGYLVECPNYQEGFFILSKNQVHEFRNLNQKEKTPERYRKLAREIRDYKIIRHIVEEDDGTRFGGEIKYKSLSFNSNQQFKRMFVFGAAAKTSCNGAPLVSISS